MLYFVAALRRERQQRRSDIADIAAGHRGGEFGKQRLRQLKD